MAKFSVREFVRYAGWIGHLSPALLHSLSQYQGDRVPVPASYWVVLQRLKAEIRQYNKLLAEQVV